MAGLLRTLREGCMVPGNGTWIALFTALQWLCFVTIAVVKAAAMEEGALTYFLPSKIVFKIVLKNFVIPLINIIHLNLNL